VGKDKLEVEVLDDGRIKVSSPGSISANNHANAEAYYRFIATMTDGNHSRTKLKQAHTHSHQTEPAKESQ
jgi:hypothetical protein